MNLKQKIKEINDKLDLSKKFPDYFNKPLLRTTFLISAVFVIILVFTYGFSDYVYMECNSDLCQNRFLSCQEPYFINSECDFFTSFDCEGVNCDKEFITKGEIIGNKPPQIVKNSGELFLFIIGLGFGVNHLLYLRRKKLQLA